MCSRPPRPARRRRRRGRRAWRRRRRCSCAGPPDRAEGVQAGRGDRVHAVHEPGPAAGVPDGGGERDVVGAFAGERSPAAGLVVRGPADQDAVPDADGLAPAAVRRGGVEQQHVGRASSSHQPLLGTVARPGVVIRSASSRAAAASSLPTRSGADSVSESTNSSQSPVVSATPRYMACTLPAQPGGGPSVRISRTRGSASTCCCAISTVRSVDASSTTTISRSACRWCAARPDSRRSWTPRRAPGSRR